MASAFWFCFPDGMLPSSAQIRKPLLQPMPTLPQAVLALRRSPPSSTVHPALLGMMGRCGLSHEPGVPDIIVASLFGSFSSPRLGTDVERTRSAIISGMPAGLSKKTLNKSLCNRMMSSLKGPPRDLQNKWAKYASIATGPSGMPICTT
jgi:hypothetical protein